MTEAPPAAMSAGPDGTLKSETTPAPWPPDTSVMTTEPRTEATAFGVWIWTVSPGAMSWRTTAGANLPPDRSRPARPPASVIVSSESSRTVTMALPPRRTRKSDFSAVAMRSRP